MVVYKFGREGGEVRIPLCDLVIDISDRSFVRGVDEMAATSYR